MKTTTCYITIMFLDWNFDEKKSGATFSLMKNFQHCRLQWQWYLLCTYMPLFEFFIAIALAYETEIPLCNILDSPCKCLDTSFYAVTELISARPRKEQKKCRLDMSPKITDLFLEIVSLQKSMLGNLLIHLCYYCRRIKYWLYQIFS